MKYGNVTYIQNNVSEEMELEIMYANDSQNPNDKKHKFEFHLFITPTIRGEEIVFCITNHDKIIYKDIYPLSQEDKDFLLVDRRCEFLHDKYKIYRNNAALTVFNNNPLDKPEKFYYQFFE